MNMDWYFFLQRPNGSAILFTNLWQDETKKIAAIIFSLISLLKLKPLGETVNEDFFPYFCKFQMNFAWIKFASIIQF